MRLFVLMTLLALMAGKSSAVAQGQPQSVHFPGETWDTRTDAQAGLSTAALDSVVSTVGGRGVITRDGYLVRSWGTYTTNFDWASASKPMLSTLLWFAVQEGLIPSVDSTVHSSGLGWSFTAADQAITWAHLANNTSGYALNEDPGASWCYNDYGIELFSESLELLFGTNVDAAMTSRLSALQIEDGSFMSANRRADMSCRDYARVGWWWLNQFKWGQSQLLPVAYHTTHVQPQVADNLPISTGSTNDYLTVGTYGGQPELDNNQGLGCYGFNFWYNGLHPDGRMWPDAPTDTYICAGHANRENVIIMPTQGIVAAWDRQATGFGQDPGNAAHAFDNVLATLAGAVL